MHIKKTSAIKIPMAPDRSLVPKWVELLCVFPAEMTRTCDNRAAAKRQCQKPQGRSTRHSK